MSWIFKHNDKVANIKNHPGAECELPHLDEAELGSIWVCDECMRIWVVVNFDTLPLSAKQVWAFRSYNTRTFACDR